MWNDSVVTDGGMTILSQWAGGGSTLDITAAKLGGGTVPAVQLVRQTNVTGFKGTADIIQHKDIDGGVQFTIRISPLEAAAVIKQIGIFGKLNGGDEKLIALYQDNDGISVPGSEMPEFAYDFNATIAADRGSDMTVNVDPMAFATKVELAEKVAELNADIASRVICYEITIPYDDVRGWNQSKAEALVSELNGKIAEYKSAILRVNCGYLYVGEAIRNGNKMRINLSTYWRDLDACIIEEDGTVFVEHPSMKSDISSIGTILEKADEAFQISQSTLSKACQVTLSAGKWIVFGFCEFSNTTSNKGYCQVGVAPSSNTVFPGSRTQYTKGIFPTTEVVSITHSTAITVNSTTAYSLFIMAGVSVKVYPHLRCIKISN